MKSKITAVLQLGVVAALAIAVGCSDSATNGAGGAGPTAGPAGPGVGPGPTTGTESGSTTSTGPGAGGSGGTGEGGAGGTGDCFMNPMTHVEIINACTNAQKVDKVEAVGNWNEGDALPPLP